MDIRNIKEVPMIPEDKVLENIWELQKDLMDGYIGKIEKDLPSYPINIHSYKGQQVLKDFSSRVVEELAEGYESTSYVCEIMNKVGWNGNLLDKESSTMILNHLQNSNEEQADALAFYIELMLYANVSIKDIYIYAKKLNEEYLHLEVLKEDNGIMGYLMDIGSVLLITKYNNVPNRYYVLDHEDKKYDYLPGFTYLSNLLHEYESKLLWDVTYHIMVSRNFLKNKPWKQTQEFTDIERYFEQIVIGFIKYMGYLNIMGFESYELYSLFYRKHMVNKFRQKSNY